MTRFYISSMRNQFHWTILNSARLIVATELSVLPEQPPSGTNVTTLPPCPLCKSEFTYADGELMVCPECAHEWPAVAAPAIEDGPKVIRDAVGNVLVDGDTITVLKDLKVKGSSQVVKVGTRVKNIRLVEGDHDIDCKIEGFGAMKLKSEFVKKA
jgi:protein PhnA